MKYLAVLIILILLGSLTISQAYSFTPKKPIIPDEVKNTARAWSEKMMSDDQFMERIQYLINEGRLVIYGIESVKNSTNPQQPIPDWVRTEIKWWSQGLESDHGFAVNIEYLFQNGYLPVEVNTTRFASIEFDPKITYDIVNGSVKETGIDPFRLFIKLSMEEDKKGLIHLNIPKEVWYIVDNKCNPIASYVLIDGEAPLRYGEHRNGVFPSNRYSETLSPDGRILEIELPSNAETIELTYSVTMEGSPTASEKGKECLELEPLKKIPPKKQLADGILLHNVVCSNDLVLVKKLSKNTVVCVKPLTAEKLVEIGRAHV